MLRNQKINRIVAGVVIFAVLASLCSLLIPTPINQTPFDFHLTLAEAILYICFNVTASIIFLVSLKGFKPHLKLAYALLATGTLLSTICLALSFLLKFAGILSSISWVMPVMTLAFVVAALLSFLGIRLFAKLLQIRSKWRLLWLTLLCALIAALLAAQLPHVEHTGVPELDLKATLGLQVFIGVISLFTLILIHKIKTTASPIFMPAMAWLFLSFLASISNIPLTMLLQLAVPGGALLVSNLWISGSFVVISGLFFIKSAMEFSRIGSSEEAEAAPGKYTFFGRLIKPDSHTHQSAIDVVIYLAGLASNPSAITTIMDDVRLITATLSPGQTLSHDQQVTLAKVYDMLKDYLVNREQVHQFTDSQIQEVIYRKFRQQPEAALNPVFWQQVDGARAGK